MTLAILQARCSSSRFPGKVLAQLHGRAMILRQIERIRSSKKIDLLVVATSDDESDDDLSRLLEGANVVVRRGPLNDVLERFKLVVDEFAPDTIVRLTADCPLTDSAVIDEVITAHLSSNSDYTSNTMSPTYPDGLDVECISAVAFYRLLELKLTAREREHVTMGLYGRSGMFTLENVAQTPDLSDLRWTVDVPDDLEFVKSIYRELYDENSQFGQTEIVNLLAERPELNRTAHDIARNAGSTL